LLREALLKAVPQKRSLHIDGHELSQEFLLVEVLNTRFIGPALPWGPQRSPATDYWTLFTFSLNRGPKCSPG
jgi:hypothetical protein